VEQILTTKFHIPSPRPQLVLRPRLIEKLNEGLFCKIILISAPAGFGKTTLVSEWLENLGKDDAASESLRNRIAWLSLDEDDNDLTRFLVYLITALQTIDTNLASESLSFIQSPQPPAVEIILTKLINEINAIPDKIILILDDYHVIESSPIDDAIAFLLEHLPPQMHLVIATRIDPQLPLARLRASCQLLELRAADLRFTLPETAEFLNQVMGLNLSEDDIAALETRTEGWIAGLQLAAISMKGQTDVSGFIKSFTGSHRFVLNYLVEEVLDLQSEEVQSFLLLTAVLRRLTGSLCNALTGQRNSQEILDKLEQSNLFLMPVNEQRGWYRYHPLFADLLYQRLCQTHGDRLPDLHLRASEWFEQNGYFDEAIEHALHGEHFNRLADLIEEHFDLIYQQGEHIKLRRWLAGLPVKLVFSRPQLCILHAWSLFSAGRPEAADKSIQAAEKKLDYYFDRAIEDLPAEEGQIPIMDNIKLRGRTAAIRAFLASYRGDIQNSLRYGRLALDVLPDDDLTWRCTAALALGDAYSNSGDTRSAYHTRLEALKTSKAAGDNYLILMSHLKVAANLRMQGKLQRVVEICGQNMRFAVEVGLENTILTGWLLAIWGETLAELNDLDGALDKALKGVSLTESGKDIAMIGWSYLCLIRVLFSRQEFSAAEELIQKMEGFSRETQIPPWISNQLSAWQVRIWLAQDKLEAALQWEDESGLTLEGKFEPLRELEYIALVRILITKGLFIETIDLLNRMLEDAEKNGRITRLIELHLLQALVLKSLGDASHANYSLDRALELAQIGGFFHIFIDEGPPMALLLNEALSQGIAPDFVRRLLSEFPVVESEASGQSVSLASKEKFIEPLSDREIEVLHHIAKGLTNQEIATRLYLSLNTVKVHTRNIYGKLLVNSRTQAIARARASGILPPN
jgi:LuxR family maltose regulon positive regulatory protein